MAEAEGEQDSGPSGRPRLSAEDEALEARSGTIVTDDDVLLREVAPVSGQEVVEVKAVRSSDNCSCVAQQSRGQGPK